MVKRPNQNIDQARSKHRPGGSLAHALIVAVFVAVVTSCSSTPPPPDPEIPVAEEETVSREAKEFVYRDQRPVSDTHPYQINDYLIYPVKWNKVEDVAPTVQELFQARYGPGIVVIPHIATNKLLIYLPPPQERERAGATGARSNLRTPTTRGTATRGRAGTTRGAR